MKITQIYRAALIVSAVFFVMYWCAPWAYGTLGGERQSLLSYNQFGAWFIFPEWFSWVFFIAVLVGYLGMFLFRWLGVWVFLGTLVINLLLSLTAGLSVITAVEVFVIDTSTLLSGFILALVFYSPLKERFY